MTWFGALHVVDKKLHVVEEPLPMRRVTESNSSALGKVDVKAKLTRGVVHVAVAVLLILAVLRARGQVVALHPPPSVSAVDLKAAGVEAACVEVPALRELLAQRRLSGSRAVPAPVKASRRVLTPVVLTEAHKPVGLPSRARCGHGGVGGPLGPVHGDEVDQCVEVLPYKKRSLAEKGVPAVVEQGSSPLTVPVPKHPVVLVVKRHVAPPPAPRELVVALEHALHLRSALLLPPQLHPHLGTGHGRVVDEVSHRVLKRHPILPGALEDALEPERTRPPPWVGLPYDLGGVTCGVETVIKHLGTGDRSWGELLRAGGASSDPHAHGTSEHPPRLPPRNVKPSVRAAVLTKLHHALPLGHRQDRRRREGRYFGDCQPDAALRGVCDGSIYRLLPRLTDQREEVETGEPVDKDCGDGDVVVIHSV
eukprot:CAMPEP_0169435430 /NCGR_PEP_ID=MMETSP1042-20121227/5059_1 /TAXON_ID=464988 /ORGANISM="Hemiselmis andersenii, Strain CCMP1180" /LENGTH=421 /DNA_ID=CAMNT_0009546073 /DNA_START=1934 /DNA_END=3200 /DNA_ORIENTATION=-